MRKPPKSKQADVRGICGARTRKGTPCRRPAGWGTDHPGVGRCKYHGGATPRGADSPHYRHGLRCRYLPGGEGGEPVTEEDLISAAEEVIGAIRWAEKLCNDPGPKPPVTVVSVLRMVVDMKERLLRMLMQYRQGRRATIDADVISDLASQLMLALDDAGVPHEYRRRIAEALRRVARAHLAG